MVFIKPIRELTFKEEVAVLQSLLCNVDGIVRQGIVDILSMFKFSDVIDYMDDIGILMNYTNENISLHISTIRGDTKWEEAKVQMLFDYLYNIAMGSK